jgi:thioesterase domain-containing protein
VDADWLVERLLAAGVLPPDTSREFFGRYVDLYRANVEAAARYRPEGPPADVPVTLFAARDEDPALGRPPATGDPTLGWAASSAHPVTVVPVPGTHVTMLAEPHVRELGRLLRTALDRATVLALVRTNHVEGEP